MEAGHPKTWFTIHNSFDRGDIETGDQTKLPRRHGMSMHKTPRSYVAGKLSQSQIGVRRWVCREDTIKTEMWQRGRPGHSQGKILPSALHRYVRFKD